MDTFKSAALFCLKSATFTIIFWGLWICILRPISFSTQSVMPSSQDSQAQIQNEAYEKQVARVNQQLDVAEIQQKRMDKNLSAQEENAKRFDAVLKTWESQGARK